MSLQPSSDNRKRARSLEMDCRYNSASHASKKLKKESSCDFTVDFLFYVCMVLNQSSPTKFNAYSLYRRIQLNRVSRPGQRQYRFQKSLYVYACVVVSSKFFEKQPYQLSVKNVWETCIKDVTTISFTELKKAEWECLLSLGFKVDCRLQSPYFWASKLLEKSKYTSKDTIEICGNLDLLLSLALLKFHHVKCSDFHLLDAMMLHIAITSFESQHGQSAEDWSGEITQILSENCRVSVSELVSSANQMLDDLMES